MLKHNESGISEKISQALDLLKQASKESQVELISIVHGLYEDVKDAQGRAIGKAKHVAGQVDGSVHKNPWAYIGGAALGGLILGLFVRLCRRSSRRE